MKKLISLSVLSIGLVCFAHAQKLKESQVPAVVKANFAKQFPGVEAKWEMEDGKYEAGFKKMGHEMSAMIEPNGTITETEMEIKTSELPKAVTDYVKKNFPNATIKEASKITKSSGEVNYEAEVNGKDLIFTNNGDFIKSVKA